MKIPKYLIKQADDLKVEKRYGYWCVVRKSDGICMMSQLHSREEAEEIIQEAKKTKGASAR